MANSMESLLESAKTYVDVLRSCNSDEVSSWKIDDLERAVNWAEYFKRVQGRIRKNPALVRKFDADLKRIGYQARLRFGGQELTSEFLGSSSDYLFTALLENRFLPAEIKDVILKKHFSCELKKHTEKFAEDQTLFATLTTIHDKLSGGLPPEVPLLQKGQPLLKADALCLLEDINWLLSQKPHEQDRSCKSPTPPCVLSRLSKLAQLENGLEVILLSTVSNGPHNQSLASSSRQSCDEKPTSSQPQGKPASSQPQGPMTGQHTTSTSALPHSCSSASGESQSPDCGAREATMQWLLQSVEGSQPQAHSSTAPPPHPHREQLHQLLLNQSPYLLAHVSSQHLKFYRVYVKMLIHLVEGLQDQAIDDFQNGVWPQTTQECLDKLCSEVQPHFKALTAAGPNVRDVTISLLRSRVVETLPKLVAVGLSHAGTTTSADSLEQNPINLWKQLLKDCTE